VSYRDCRDRPICFADPFSTSDDGTDRSRRRALQVQVCAIGNISRIAEPHKRSEPCDESRLALFHSNGDAGAARSRAGAARSPTMMGRMKRRNRTSDDGSLPVVTRRPDGKYSVQISHCASIVWHSMPDCPDHERFIVVLETPAATEIITRETFKISITDKAD